MNSTHSNKITDADWWRGAVIYQIYPRSFQDSNQDGIGDLDGIRYRLPYIKELGADAIWISPFFTSPMKDFGYDVSNYRDVDPMFGSIESFDAMIERAHDLNLKVMIDLVISHTSDQHPWFVDSRASNDGPKHDWYVWADAKPDGTAPNNWLSIFGGPAWSWDTTRLQYYMHNFLTSQPDLNFHNLDVQEALLDVARFWLEKGVDGFRLDTINFYFCDSDLRDNPALPITERNSEIAPAVNPYNYQNHLYDKSQPENIEFLEKLRALMDEYPATTAVGEVGDAQIGMKLLADYTKGTHRVHMCYTFDFLSPALPTALHVRSILEQFQKLGDDNWICWAFSNHDVIRHATRWQPDADPNDQYLKVLASLLLSLRGSVCLYQGEELGLPEAELELEDLQDPYGIKFWPEFKGRDGCRTPMVWESVKVNGGFSEAKPWLPVPQAHLSKSVDTQIGQPDSLLEHYKHFLSFRRKCQPLVKGILKNMYVQGEVLCFTRQLDNDSVFCAFNLSTQSATVEISSGDTLQLIDGHAFDVTVHQGTISMPAHSACFARIG